MTTYREIYGLTLQKGGYSQVKGKRFMVGTPIEERVFSLDTFSPQDVKQYIEDVKEHISENTGVGTWVNEKDGNVYLDVSTGFNDKEKAIAQAKEWNQLAIYDTVLDETIDI